MGSHCVKSHDDNHLGLLQIVKILSMKALRVLYFENEPLSLLKYIRYVFIMHYIH